MPHPIYSRADGAYHYTRNGGCGGMVSIMLIGVLVGIWYLL